MNFQELSATLDPRKRYHFTYDNLTLDDAKIPKLSGVGKPCGLWYSCGQEWSEWCIGEDWAHAGYTHLYEIELGSSNLVSPHTSDDIVNLVNTYRGGIPAYEDAPILRDEISWEKVKADYDGIEINPFHKDLWRAAYPFVLPPMFIIGWDVSSGCVWNTNKVKLKLIAKKQGDIWTVLDNGSVQTPSKAQKLARKVLQMFKLDLI